MTQNIETLRLTLVNCTLPLLEALFAGNDSLSDFMGVTVPGNWTEFGAPAFKWTYDKLRQPGIDTRWWSYLPVYKKDNILVGSCGYKGGPDINGMVEVGYEITPAYRNRGLATELTLALINHAVQDDSVKLVLAHTLAEENASVKVLKKCGMHFVKEINDPDDGLLWQWELVKTISP